MPCCDLEDCTDGVGGDGNPDGLLATQLVATEEREYSPEESAQLERV